jgi:hypothetical protein
MKSSVIWNITQCSLLTVNRHFGDTCSLRLQGRRITQARRQRESSWQAEQIGLPKFRIVYETGGKWKTTNQLPLARAVGQDGPPVRIGSQT